MNYRKFGKSDFKVSEIGFGCWGLGGNSYGPTDDKESLKALDAAWDQGVNFYDTADIYGEGHSEEVLCFFIQTKPRHEMIIASKVGHDFYKQPIKKNFSKEYIRLACEKSLKRLKIDHIDIYQLHNPVVDIIDQGDAITALMQLKKEGKIRLVGVSAINADGGAAALRNPAVESLQVEFNLLDQRVAESVLPEAQEKGVGIIAREPLACGLLTGKYNADSVFAKTDHRRGWSKEMIQTQVDKMTRIQETLSLQTSLLKQVSLEYLLKYEAVSTVIPGMKTIDQVQDNLKPVKKPLLEDSDAEKLRELYEQDPVFKLGLT